MSVHYHTNTLHSSNFDQTFTAGNMVFARARCRKNWKSWIGESASFTSKTNKRMSLNAGTAGRDADTKTCFANLINMVLNSHTQTLHYMKLKSSSSKMAPNKDCRLTRHGSDQLHAPASSPWAKEPPVPTEYEKSWTPEPVWAFYKTEKALAPGGNGITIPRLPSP
jgi:hypothetical protein